jgi:hypothetical protein
MNNDHFIDHTSDDSPWQFNDASRLEKPVFRATKVKFEIQLLLHITDYSLVGNLQCEWMKMFNFFVIQVERINLCSPPNLHSGIFIKKA